MTESLPAAFATTLTAPEPPAGWPASLAALWWLARDTSRSDPVAWDRAHHLVQNAVGPDAAWVHAHLHRIEGDDGNARYWYGRAGRPGPLGTPAEERMALIAALWTSS